MRTPPDRALVTALRATWSWTDPEPLPLAPTGIVIQGTSLTTDQAPHVELMVKPTVPPAAETAELCGERDEVQAQVGVAAASLVVDDELAPLKAQTR